MGAIEEPFALYFMIHWDQVATWLHSHPGTIDNIVGGFILAIVLAIFSVIGKVFLWLWKFFRKSPKKKPLIIRKDQSQYGEVFRLHQNGSYNTQIGKLVLRLPQKNPTAADRVDALGPLNQEESANVISNLMHICSHIEKVFPELEIRGDYTRAEKFMQLGRKKESVYLYLTVFKELHKRLLVYSGMSIGMDRKLSELLDNIQTIEELWLLKKKIKKRAIQQCEISIMMILTNISPYGSN